MHLTTIAAFAFLFWQVDAPERWILTGADDVVWTLGLTWGQPVLFWITARWAGVRILRVHDREAEDSPVAHVVHQRTVVGLRVASTLTFAAVVFLTRWPMLVRVGPAYPALQIFSDLVVLVPYFGSQIAIWAGLYPLESSFRKAALESLGSAEADRESWSLGRHLNFHVRHYLMSVAVPMTLILFCANITRGYENRLIQVTGWLWTPDVLLGLAAAAVFVAAPEMLRRVWETRPLPEGPVRARMESLCRRIGFRCQGILLWKGDGLMINAAVMGVVPRMRYVLLSEPLVAVMSPEQLESVLGHEAAHVRQAHIPCFLLYAFIGWALVAGVMEIQNTGTTALGVLEPRGPSFLDRQVGSLGGFVVPLGGAALVTLGWIAGFGWLSRRFERQADAFGARCVTPESEPCRFPCSVHRGSVPLRNSARASDPRAPGLYGATKTAPSVTVPSGVRVGSISGHRICMTAATLFVSALEQVAVLNGIPREERNWRHSSIGNRVRSLIRMAGDPKSANVFERDTRRVKVAILVLAVVCGTATVYYWLTRLPHAP